MMEKPGTPAHHAGRFHRTELAEIRPREDSLVRRAVERDCGCAGLDGELPGEGKHGEAGEQASRNQHFLSPVSVIRLSAWPKGMYRFRYLFSAYQY
ncbi:MAG: hypothetical protein WEA77_05595 [Hyphomonas sp.]|uniref:hypothetical protein n=1 Tax=Hyphomonas sp. TaxID=87 RepID=UPI0034A0340A